MTIEFSCPQCGRRVRTPESAAGKRGQCPQCGAAFQIPSPAKPAAQPAADSMDVACPGCGRTLRVPASAAGKQGQCPHCRARFPIPAAASSPPQAGAAIAFHCPGCQRLLRTPPGSGGKRGKCPHCGAVLNIPAQSTAAGAAAASASSSTEPLDDLLADLPPLDAAPQPTAAMPVGWADPKRLERAKRKRQPKQPKARRDWGPRDGLPWERPTARSKYLGTALKLLFSPNEAFGLMRRGGGVGQPLGFAILGQLTALGIGLTYWLLAQLILLGAAVAQAGGQVNMARLKTTLLQLGIGLAVGAVGGAVLVVVTTILLSLLYAALHHLALMLMDAADYGFETTYRVVAYSLGAIGVTAIVPCVGGIVGLVAYVMLLIIGFRNAQGATLGKAAAAAFVPALASCILLIPVGLLAGDALSQAIEAARAAWGGL